MDNKGTTEKSDELEIDLILVLYKEIQFLFDIVRKRLILFGALALAGGIAGIVYVKTSTPLYNATMTFVMKSEGGNINASLSSLNNLFGGGGAGNNPLARINEIIDSDKIVGKALLIKADVDGKEELLINHYIQFQGLEDAWKEDSLLKGVRFSDNMRYEDLDLAHRKAIRNITGAVSGKNKKGLIKKSVDKKSGIVTMAVAYKNEAFAIAFTNALYEMVVDFYNEQSTAMIKRNVDILEYKADSIRRAFDRIRRSSAINTDQSLGITLQQDRVAAKELAYEENLLAIMYAEVLKNLESMRFIEASNMPSFTILDAPFSPIVPAQKSLKIFLAVGLFLPVFFGLLGIRFYLLFKHYKEKFITN